MDKVEGEVKASMAMEWDGEDRGAAGAETASAYQLRVLSGRHSGAIMPLPPGRHSLGQDEECDFIFLDDAFLGGRVILDLTGTEPAIETTGLVKANLDGQELPTGKASPLPAYQAVEVGTTRFAIGPSAQPWPEPPAPKPAPGSASPETNENGNVGEDARTAASPGDPPEGNAEAEAPTRKASRRLGPWVLAAALVLLAALGGLTLRLRPSAVPDPAETLKGILAELRLSEVRVESAAGVLQLKGFLRAESERDSLSLRLEGFHHPVGTRLISAEEIRSAIQGVLDLYHMECPVSIGPAGKTTVACVLENPGIIKEMTEALRQAAPPEAELELHLQPASEAYAFVNAQLSAKILDHKIHPEARQGRMACVLVRNRMDSLEMKAWNGIREAFRARFGLDLDERWTDRLSPVLLRFQNIARALDTQLVGVTVGDMSYITLKRRRKYFEGARLAGGICLKSIRNDRIVLSLDNVEQNYFFKKGTK